MASLAHELEKDALDPNTQISTLLRKALVAAKKLEDAEFERWVSYELKGYPGDAELPDYRKISGRIVAEHSRQGWMVVSFTNMPPEFHKNMSTFHFRNSIGDIVSMATGTRGTEITDSVIVYYDKETQHRIMRAMNYPAIPGIEYNRSQFRRVLDNVRTAVLEWAVEYQKKTKAETPSEGKPDRKSKLSYINENRAWMFEGLGTQLIVGGITVIGSLAFAYLMTKTESPQVNTPPVIVSTPAPTLTPTPIPTPTPTPNPTPTPKSNTAHGRNTKT